MRRFQIYLSEPQMATLKDLSKTQGISVAELIRRAVDDFLKKEKGYEKVWS